MGKLFDATQHVPSIVLSISIPPDMCFGSGKERKPAWKKGHAWKGIDRCCDRWKDGRGSLEGYVVVLYILLSLPSVR